MPFFKTNWHKSGTFKDFKNVKTRFLYKFPNSNLPAVTNSEDILEKMVLGSFDNFF